MINIIDIIKKFPIEDKLLFAAGIFIILVVCICGTSLSINVGTHEDKVEDIVQHKDTNFIYYTVPQKELVKFGKLQKHRWDGDTTLPYELRPTNQEFWKYVRGIFDYDFEPYYKDGLYYVWAPIVINSNAAAIGNTSSFNFHDTTQTKHYIRYK